MIGSLAKIFRKNGDVQIVAPPKPTIVYRTQLSPEIFAAALAGQVEPVLDAETRELLLITVPGANHETAVVNHV